MGRGLLGVSVYPQGTVCVAGGPLIALLRGLDTESMQVKSLQMPDGTCPLHLI